MSKKHWLSFVALALISSSAMALTLKSSAFYDAQPIPTQYTCDGTELSPPLEWDDVPHGTESFVLTMDDPDTGHGTWDHWVLYNIPSATRSLAENEQSLPAGTQIGSNSWKRAQYNGPCPPTHEHRYFFKLFALSTTLNLADGATKNQVEAAMRGHILGHAQLMGKYNRLLTRNG